MQTIFFFISSECFVGEYLDVISEKFIKDNLLNYSLKIKIDKNKDCSEILNKTIELKIYIFDTFVDFNLVKENQSGLYDKYIKTIRIKIEENNLIMIFCTIYSYKGGIR